ncbi:hypothetical protein ABW19_dt0207062 [Dactylella cylindrospora]|nr:hypothetical protein ABW19_dt0207062 [Dactylella cylindrospora]
MKERYNQELAEYKKTDSYKEYTQYLAEFKAKTNQKDAAGVSAGGPTATGNVSSRPQHQHAGESPGYQAASIAAGHYASAPGRRESYTSPFTQPSTPASQMVSPIAFGEPPIGSGHGIRQYPPGQPSASYEAVTLPFRDSPGRPSHPHPQYYEQGRPSHASSNPEDFDQRMTLPRLNPQPHIQPVLSYSRGQPSPGDSPSQHSRRSGSISGTSYQRPALHPSDTLSTQNSISSSGSSSAPSLTPATPLDGDGRQIHGHSLRALPPLRNPSPSQQSSSSYFAQRSREMSGSGGSSGGYPGHGSTSSSPRSQLPSLAEQSMVQEQQSRRGERLD